MKHLLHGIGPEDGSVASGLSAWLRHGSSSLARFRAQGFSAGADPVDELAKMNVIQQLENLRALAVVREAESRGQVRLVGMMFDIAAACALILDESTGRFDLPGGAEKRLPSRRASRRAMAAQTGGLRIDAAGLVSLVKGLRPVGSEASGSVAAGQPVAGSAPAGHGAAGLALAGPVSAGPVLAGPVSAGPVSAGHGAQPGGVPASSWQGVLPLPRVQGTPSEGLPAVGRPGDGSSARRPTRADGAAVHRTVLSGPGVSGPGVSGPGVSGPEESPRSGSVPGYGTGYGTVYATGYGAGYANGYDTGYAKGYDTGYPAGYGYPGPGEPWAGKVGGPAWPEPRPGPSPYDVPVEEPGGRAGAGWRERA